MGNEVSYDIPEGNDHLTAQEFATWQADASPTAEHERLTDHLIACASCSAQLVMIRQAVEQQNEELEQSPEFTNLLRAGETAARQAFKQQGEAVSSSKQVVERPQAVMKPSFWQQLIGLQPAFRWAAVAVLLPAILLPLYWYKQQNEPVEAAMLSLRGAWPEERPIEARITGGFPYRPYRVTRGSGDKPKVDDIKLLDATSRLTKAILEKPSSQALQALGKIQLLNAEYEKAENQLRDAIKRDPQNASAYIDLAACLYEKGKIGNNSISILADAAQECDKAIKLDPQSVEGWFNRALISEEMKNYAQAIEAWENFIKLDPNSAWATEAKARLENLRKQARLREPHNTELYTQLLIADLQEDQLLYILRERYSESADLLVNRFFGEYIIAKLQSDLSKLRQLESGISRLVNRIKVEKGEHFYSDLYSYLHNCSIYELKRVQTVQENLYLASKHLSTGNNGEIESAILLIEEAYALAKQLNSVCLSRLALSRLVRVRNSRQVDRIGLDQLRKHLRETTEALGYRQLHALSLLADANFYLADQQLNSALLASIKAKEISEKISDYETAADAERFTAISYSKMKNDSAIYSSVASSLGNLWRSAPTTLQACKVYSTVAESLDNASNFGAAFSYQLEAFQFCRQCSTHLKISSLVRTGGFYARAGDTSQAVRLWDEGFAIAKTHLDPKGDNNNLPDIYTSLGKAYSSQGMYGQSVAAYQKVIESLGKGQNYRSAEVQYELGTIYLKQRQTELAEKALESSISLIEKTGDDFIQGVVSRGAYLESENKAYRAMVELQFSLKGNEWKAFEYTERHRSRELLALLSAKSQSQIQYSKITSLQEMQDKLSPDTQLVEYAITDRQLFIWVITKDGFNGFNIPVSAVQLHESVRGYLSQLSGRKDKEGLRQSSNELYRMLIKPVAERLSEKRLLVVIPDGIINSIPFAALTNPQNDRYLIEDFALAQNPSAVIALRLMGSSRSSYGLGQERLLVISDPRFNAKLYSQLKRLPSAEAEMNSITPYYQRPIVLKGEGATLEMVVKDMKLSEVVHFATHSILDEKNPGNSAIVLASGGDTNLASPNREASDSLTAEQIVNLNLPLTKLVVLSSCSSGATIMTEGKGLGGLAHAFLSTGVKAVIASLWEVDDGSTAELMSEFHKAYRVNRKSFSQSLQQAQLAMLRSNKLHWRSPYYWAAFFINGNGLLS